MAPLIPLRTLIPQLWAGESTKCSYLACSREITRGDECFADTLSEANFCQQCGLSLRFHRKKANERGDPCPLTFEEVGKKEEHNP